MKQSLFLICILLIICPNGGDQAHTAEKVTLQIRWDHQFQFAGYYAAKWQGYYEAAGLDVDIRSAVTNNGILSAVEEVQSGQADFGIGAADILMANDKGADLVLLGSIFQHSAAGFYTRNDTRIDTLSDLLNLKVARRVNDLIDVELQALLMSEGISPKKIHPYPHQPGMAHLTGGQVDVVPGYIISFPFEAQTDGIQLKTFRPIAYGVDFYGDSLFTRQSIVNEHSDTFERFLNASLKGW